MVAEMVCLPTFIFVPNVGHVIFAVWQPFQPTKKRVLTKKFAVTRAITEIVEEEEEVQEEEEEAMDHRRRRRIPVPTRILDHLLPLVHNFRRVLADDVPVDWEL